MSSGTRMLVVLVEPFAGFARLHCALDTGDVRKVVFDVPRGPGAVVPAVGEFITVFLSWRPEGVRG